MKRKLFQLAHKIYRKIDDNYLRLYWKCIRYNRESKNAYRTKLNRNRWWHKGLRLTLVITTRCNLHCDYCPMFLTDDKYPKFKESTLDEWKEYFENFPDWCSEVVISGGEPTIISYLPDLINWLMDRGHHVIVYTNLLKPETLYGVKDSFKFAILPTFHHTDNAERYEEAYNKLKGRFRIVSQELENMKLGFSFFKHLYTRRFFFENDNVFHIAPDAPRTKKLYLGANALYKDGK